MGLGTCLKPGEKLVPQKPAGTLKLSFRHAQKGNFVQGTKVVVGTDGYSYSGLLKRHQKEKDTAAIQIPLNIGPVQYLVRAAIGNVGSGSQRLLSLSHYW